MYSLGVLGILENYFKRIEFIVNYPPSNERGGSEVGAALKL